MIVRRYSDIKAQVVDMDGAKGVAKRVLVSEADGAPNFIMRQFIVEPGGYTPYHTHNWEHEIYVLSGRGQVLKHGGFNELEAGSVVFVAPNEEHGFENTGDEPLVFLCSIPK